MVLEHQKNGYKPFFQACIISACTILSRLTGMVRAIIMASFLGSGIIAEALYTAIRLPNTFRKIFAEGAFSNAFVPFYSYKIKENKKTAALFSNTIFKLLCIVLIILTIFIECFMPVVIRMINPGFITNKEKFDIAVILSRICFPYILLISLTSFFGSILNSVGSFWQYSIISVLLNIIIIFGLLLTNTFFTTTGHCVSWLLIIGGCLQLMFLIFFCYKKSLLPFTKFNIQEELKQTNKREVKSFFKKIVPAIISSGILQINVLVDGIFASFFNGALAYLYYTDRLINFPLSIIGYSLSVAILPMLSVAYREEDYLKIKNLQTQAVNIAMFFAIPATFLFFSLSKEIIAIIYQHGAFNASDTKVVASMMMIYSFSIPFNILMKIFFSCFYAKKNTKTPMYISLFSLLLNVILNLILFKIIGMYCVVVATTIASIFSFGLTIFFLIKNNCFYINKIELISTLKILFISLFSCICLPILIKHIFIKNIIFILIICGIIHFFFMFKINILNKNFIRLLVSKK